MTIVPQTWTRSPAFSLPVQLFSRARIHSNPFHHCLRRPPVPLYRICQHTYTACV